MIPYLEPPSFTLFGYTVHVFALTTLLAIYTGIMLVTWRAARYGLDRDEVLRVVILTVIAGLLGSHWFAELAYSPERVAADPMRLLRFSESMSSFGGILGGLAGAAVVMRLRGWSRDRALRFVDLVGWAFPFAWLFGRLGCSLAHDHIGIPSTAFIAVRFPDGPRLDLGLIEWLLTILWAAAFLLLDRRPRPAGFYLALSFTIYGPLRFGLDFLRTYDARYLGLTPAQFLAIGIAAIGVTWLFRLLRARPA